MRVVLSYHDAITLAANSLVWAITVSSDGSHRIARVWPRGLAPTSARLPSDLSNTNTVPRACQGLDVELDDGRRQDLLVHMRPTTPRRRALSKLFGVSATVANHGDSRRSTSGTRRGFAALPRTRPGGQLGCAERASHRSSSPSGSARTAPAGRLLLAGVAWGLRCSVGGGSTIRACVDRSYSSSSTSTNVSRSSWP
jgi:hypothetical protein